MAEENATDPIASLADKVTPTPSAAEGTLGADTAIIDPSKTADTLFPDTLLKANKQIYDQQKAARDDANAKIFAGIKAHDFDYANLFPEDQAALLTRGNQFLNDWSAPNKVGAFTNEAKYAPLTLQMQQGYDTIKADIDKAKADNLLYTAYTKQLQDHPDLYDVDASQKNLDKFRTSKFGERDGSNLLVPKQLYNPVTSKLNLLSELKPEPVTIGVVNPDGTKTTTVVNKVDPKDFVQTLNTNYQKDVLSNGYLDYVKGVKQQIAAGTTPNITIPKYDIDNLFNKKTGQIQAVGTTTLADATPFETSLYEHAGAYHNYVSKDVTLPESKENKGESVYAKDVGLLPIAKLGAQLMNNPQSITGAAPLYKIPSTTTSQSFMGVTIPFTSKTTQGEAKPDGYLVTALPNLTFNAKQHKEDENGTELPIKQFATRGGKVYVVTDADYTDPDNPTKFNEKDVFNDNRLIKNWKQQIITPYATKTYAATSGTEDVKLSQYYQQQKLDDEAKQLGIQPIGGSGQVTSTAKQTQGKTKTPTVSSEQDYNALPNGAHYIYNGIEMIKGGK